MNCKHKQELLTIMTPHNVGYYILRAYECCRQCLAFQAPDLTNPDFVLRVLSPRVATEFDSSTGLILYHSHECNIHNHTHTHTHNHEGSACILEGMTVKQNKSDMHID